MNNEVIEKAGEIIHQNTVYGTQQGSDPFCVLALIDKEGYPTASTITASQSEGIEWITFCTGLTSNKANRIADCNHASVCFNKDGAYNITLVGTIEVVTEPSIKQAMWYEGLEQHFSSPDDPQYCVLHFSTNRYNLFIDWQETAGYL